MIHELNTKMEYRKIYLITNLLVLSQNDITIKSCSQNIEIISASKACVCCTHYWVSAVSPAPLSNSQSV